MDVVKPTSNLFGGSLFAKAAREVWRLNTLINSDNERYISFRGLINGDLEFSNYFVVKENTQYTFLFDIEANSSVVTFVIYYTDGSYSNVSCGPGRKMVRFVSKANATIHYAGIQQRNTTRSVYIDTSGVFEGVVSVDDFEPWRG